MAIHPSVTIFDQQAFDSINADFEIEVLNNRCTFSEGPVWNKAGFYLYSDIPKNRIEKLASGSKAEVYLEPSGCSPGNTRQLSEQVGSNGLAYYGDEGLLICQHGNGAIAMYDGADVVPFIATYENKPFNSPNDVIAHPDGQIFFSDPPYGLKDQQLQPEVNQPLAGIYCWKEGAVTLFSSQYNYPNGVCLSPDGRSLYTCSNKPNEAFVLEWNTATLKLKGQVCAENGDGIKCDRRGNLYLCSKDGIIIVNSKGKRLARIQLETTPANCCWGGADMNDLLVTARQNIFLIRSLQKR